MKTRRRGREAGLGSIRHRGAARRAGNTVEGRAEQLVVHELGTLGLRKNEPDNGQSLESVVEGEPVEHEAHKGLNEVEEAKDNPVGKPLDVVLGLRSLQSNQREVHRDKETNEVGQEASGTTLC